MFEFGGAAGTLSSLGKDGLKVQVELAKELGLAQPEIAWHTVRDRIAETGCFLGLLTGLCGKIALDDATRALMLDPNALAGLLERGNIRRLKGDRDGAKSDWQRILQLDAKSPEAKAARDNLARLAAQGAVEPGTGSTAKPSAKP